MCEPRCEGLAPGHLDKHFLAMLTSLRNRSLFLRDINILIKTFNESGGAYDAESANKMFDLKKGTKQN